MLNAMSSAERMMALAQYKPIDRVPVLAFASAYTGVICGMTLKEYYLEPQKSLAAQFWAADLHQYDGAPTYGIPSWVGWDFGGELVFPETPKVCLPVLAKRPVSSADDLEKLIMPELDTAPAASRMLQFARLAREKDLPVGAFGGSPLEAASSIVGTDLLFRWFYKEPKLAHQVIRLATDYMLKLADRFINEFGAENCTAFTPYPIDCHAMISPKVFQEFSLPYIQEIHNNLINKGINKWFIHLCSDHTHNLQYWKEIKLAPRSVISIGHEMELEQIAKFFGEQYIVAGNIPTNILMNGTQDDVTEACKATLIQMKHTPGGFLLAPACGLPPLTPPANVHAMVKAARMYGCFGGDN